MRQFYPPEKGNEYITGWRASADCDAVALDFVYRKQPAVAEIGLEDVRSVAPVRVVFVAPRRPLPPPPPAPTQTTYAIFSPGCFVQVSLLVYSRMMYCWPVGPRVRLPIMRLAPRPGW